MPSHPISNTVPVIKVRTTHGITELLSDTKLTQDYFLSIKAEAPKPWVLFIFLFYTTDTLYKTNRQKQTKENKVHFK